MNVSDEKKNQMDMLSQAAANITFIEIMQAVRHEARNIIDSCQGSLAILMMNSNEKIKEKGSIIESISEQLQTLCISLDKIKSASHLIENKRLNVDLHSVWNDAIGIVSSPLSRLNISVTYKGESTYVHIMPDQFRLVFLNLLLNSIDAFHNMKRKTNRQISLKVFSASDDIMLKIQYSDNAGGIDFTKITSPASVDAKQGIVEPNAIFEPYITSKKNGLGVGLFFVKQALNIHHGTIDITNHKGGVVFDILIPASAVK